MIIVKKQLSETNGTSYVISYQELYNQIQALPQSVFINDLLIYDPRAFFKFKLQGRVGGYAKGGSIAFASNKNNCFEFSKNDITIIQYSKSNSQTNFLIHFRNGLFCTFNVGETYGHS